MSGGQCFVCGKRVRITKHGLTARHNRNDYVCPGSRTEPREEVKVMAHTERVAKTIENNKHGIIEIVVAVGERSEDEDAIIIRTSGAFDLDGEVWIATSALDAVASALKENGPQQLSLFDKEDY